VTASTPVEAPEGARWLSAPSGDAQLLVLQSPFWSYNNIALVSRGEACLFDPGARPADIQAIGAAARLDGREITELVVTHSHHDHIRGWDSFPGARVWLPAAAQAKSEAEKQRDLDFKEAIDLRLGVPHPTRAFPHSEHAFEEQAELRVGDLEVSLRFLPGHSLCTSVAFIPALKTLISADYLVSPGLPYCRWQPREFERGMRRLRAWCVELEIEHVWPAHNEPILGHEAVLTAIDEESAYFDHLRQVVRELLAAGEPSATAVRKAAQAMRARRGPSAGVRERQDGDNARRVVAEELAAR
jgi:glyoxylase-like metal-dependent hydrolase (beta-lactamase superfamily II)